MKTAIFIIIVGLSLGLCGECFAGRYCEVVNFSAYESPGIATVDGMIVQVIRRCAVVTIRNTDDRSRYATDYDLTAYFEDGEKSSRHIDREEDRLKSVESGGEYTTFACFGPSDSPIARVDCGY